MNAIQHMVSQMLRPPTPEPPRAREKPQKQYSRYVSEKGPAIYELRRQGLTFQQIADKLGVSMGSVSSTHSLYRRLIEDD